MSSALHPAPSILLSDTDGLILQRYGRDITEDAVGMIAESVFCSAYGIFFAVAVYSIIRKGVRWPGSSLLLFAVVYLYVASVTQWALDLSSALENIHSLLMVPNITIPERAGLADENIERFAAAREALFIFNMIIGDAIIVWRTWVIYQGKPLAIGLPCLLLLTSFVFGLIDITCLSYEGPLPGGARICVPASPTAWAFSVTTNVICTIFVWFRAWQHRNLMRELHFPEKHRKLTTEHVLSLLVESGFAYSLLWLTQILDYLPFGRGSSWDYVWQISNALGHQVAGMYPTLIIVIVNFKRTMWEESTSTPGKDTVSNSLHWVVRSRATDTFGTQRGVGTHLETVTEASPACSVASATV